MTISVNWKTKVIFVPKADLTLVQSLPVEILEMNLNWFRLQLKDIEDDEGMPFLDTHRHNTEVSISGITLARVIEIINGYTVTFEDGQYAVNLVGANSNVGDVVNVNQVSVRTSNSAGMTSSQDIEYASYQNCVTVDLTSPYAGTTHPIGTVRQPVNNLTDALLIANYRGLNTLRIIGDATIDSNGNYSGMTILGESMTKSEIFIESSANVYRAEFYDCCLEGTLDGEAMAKNCRIHELSYINGVVEQCLLGGEEHTSGIITLGGAAGAVFLDCWSGGSQDHLPIIDLGGSGQELIIRNYSGGLRLRNKTGTEQVSITLASGTVIIESTVVAGTIKISGVGTVTNLGTADLDTSELLNSAEISNQVLAAEIETGIALRQAQRAQLAAAVGKFSGATGNSDDEWVELVNAGDGARVRIRALVDRYGNRKQIVLDLN